MNSKRILTILVLFALLIATTSVAFASQDIDDISDMDDSDDDLSVDEDLDDNGASDDDSYEDDDSDSDLDDDDDDWEDDDSDDDLDDDDDDWEDDDSDDDLDDDDDDLDDDDDDWYEWDDEDLDDLDDEDWEDYDGETTKGDYKIIGRIVKYNDGIPLILYKAVSANGAKTVYYSKSSASNYSDDASDEGYNATSSDDEVTAFAGGSFSEPLSEQNYDLPAIVSASKSVSKSIANPDDGNATVDMANEKIDTGENTSQYGLYGLIVVLLVCIIAAIYKRN